MGRYNKQRKAASISSGKAAPGAAPGMMSAAAARGSAGSAGPRRTLDQQRAAFAWQCAQQAESAGFIKSYGKLAKQAGTLIISGGLMPTLAFYSSKRPKDERRDAAREDMSDSDSASLSRAYVGLRDDLVRGLSRHLDGKALHDERPPERLAASAGAEPANATFSANATVAGSAEASVAQHQAFKQLIQRLQQSDASVYLRATDEALELVKWIHQFADAIKPASDATRPALDAPPAQPQG